MPHVTRCWKRPTVSMLKRQQWQCESHGDRWHIFMAYKVLGGMIRSGRVLERSRDTIFFVAVILDKHRGQRFAKMHVNLCHLWNCTSDSITVAPGLVYQGALISVPRTLSVEVKHHDADLGHLAPSIMAQGDRNDVTPDHLHINHRAYKADVSPDVGRHWSSSTRL